MHVLLNLNCYFLEFILISYTNIQIPRRQFFLNGYVHFGKILLLTNGIISCLMSKVLNISYFCKFWLFFIQKIALKEIKK